MKSGKAWFEGLKWAKSVFKEMYFYNALEYVEDKINGREYDNFDEGAKAYCNHVRRNINIFQYRFNDDRFGA
jgi:hypothetical protein